MKPSLELLFCGSRKMSREQTAEGSVRHRARVRNRIIGGVIALAIVATMVNLGLWQLRRHNEKQQLTDRVESRIGLDPIGLEELYEESVLSGGIGLLGGADGVKQVEYRRVAEVGRFICDKEVLIRNRTRDGRPGYWVFTPYVVFEDGWDVGLDASEENEESELALQGQATYIVNRGWLPLELAEAAVLSNTAGADIPMITPPLDTPLSSVLDSEFLPSPEELLAALPPPDPNPCNTIGVEMTGFIRLPRSGAAKECESLAPACTFAHPDTQAIASHFSSLESDPLDVRSDFYIQMASSEPVPEDSPVILRAPSFDEGNHFNYAVQWFIFSTVAAVGYFLIFWRKAVFKHKGRSRAPSSD